MEKFSYEEMSLLRMLDIPDRESLRCELLREIHAVDRYTDREVVNLLCSTLETLDTLTDEEYEAVSDQFYDADFYAEEDAGGS